MVIERTWARVIARGRGGCATAKSGDGVSAAGGDGATASAVPAEYEAQSGYRWSAGGSIRQAAADTAGRVPADGLQPSGRLRVRPADAQVGSGRTECRDGLVHPLHHGDPADAGLDKGSECQRGALPVVPAEAGGAGLAATRGLARARHPPHRPGRRRGRHRTRLGLASSGPRDACRRPRQGLRLGASDQRLPPDGHPSSRPACGRAATRGRWSAISGPCGRGCRRCCPATRGPTSTRGARTRRTTRSSSSTSLKRSSGSGPLRSITAGRIPVWSIRVCRTCGCSRRRCSSTAWCQRHPYRLRPAPAPGLHRPASP